LPLLISVLLVSCTLAEGENQLIATKQPLKKAALQQKVLPSGFDASKHMTKMTYDEGHQTLQMMIDSLAKHADGLGRGDYIGYMYATGELYQYLLAIYYKGKDVLDANYFYHYPYQSFMELCDMYHRAVDFTTIDIVDVNHKGFDIDLTLSYTNRQSQMKGYLTYKLSYGVHGLHDLTSFE
jgi:hypothetical protein